jgi:chorismate mutase/prephenate dehydratase
MTTPATVSYPGREGAHTAAAAEALYPDATLVASASFGGVVADVASGASDVGVLPIESSLAGPVAETHDLLAESHVAVIAETVLPIHHCLAGVASVPLDEVRVVHSHPMALDQCRRLLAELHDATTIAAPTTADAARAIALRADPTHVAIASPRAAEANGLTVLREDVGDRAAFTRFVAVAPYLRLDEGARWRTSLILVTDHRPGSLHRALGPFAHHGVDLVQLVSRPLPDRVWHYRFDAILDGHPRAEHVRAALRDAARETRELRVTGSYPAADAP